MTNKRQRAFSLAELMVASFSFLLVMLVALGALAVVRRSSRHLEGRSVPRQQLRVLLGHLQHEVRGATYVYDTTLALSFGAQTHTFSGSPPSDPNTPAIHDMVLALPESADLNPTYRVMGLYLEPQPKPPYPNAHRVVLAEVSNLSPVTPGTPADIPLAALPNAGAGVRTFSTASPLDGLRIRLSPTLDGLEFEFVIGHKTEGESVLYETYQANFTMRNNR